ncbi:MAG TPA: DNA primase small subunit domain-containing protein, partial [Candidatus Bilamarchaeaceae archaeon]|nr:DNA primase small subunit domain-containing protein [Candidatus Bilamarchaeaceae archaeon]
MNEKAKNQIVKIFSRYYAQARLEILQPAQREFGMGNIKKIDHRHMAFPGLKELQAYLANNPPLFVSHSTAYYRYPEATPIEKKEWLGADVVFDLDLHAEEKFGIYRRLDSVKQDTLRLMEEFLLRDFGLEKKDLLVVFSGNRGYHVHIRHKDFLPIGSNERKELVDYIRGLGLNYEGFFTREEIKRGMVKLLGPRPTEDGYRGRFARAVILRVEKEPTSIARIFAKPEPRDRFIGGIREGNWSKAPVKDIMPRLKPITDQLPLQSVNADAGVT